MNTALIKALALILCVLLSACGGGDEENPPQEGAGAVSIAATGGTSFVDAVSAVAQAESGAARTVEVEGSISSLRFDAGATLAPPADFVSAILVLYLDGQPVSMATLADSSEAEVVPDARRPLSGSAKIAFAIPAGKRLTAVVSVGGATDNNGAVIAWDGAMVRITVRP